MILLHQPSSGLGRSSSADPPYRRRAAADAFLAAATGRRDRIAPLVTSIWRCMLSTADAGLTPIMNGAAPGICTTLPSCCRAWSAAIRVVYSRRTQLPWPMLCDTTTPYDSNWSMMGLADPGGNPNTRTALLAGGACTSSGRGNAGGAGARIGDSSAEISIWFELDCRSSQGIDAECSNRIESRPPIGGRSGSRTGGAPRIVLSRSRSSWSARPGAE